MGVEASLISEDGRRVTGLEDPAGGTFDVAGDFQRLLSTAAENLEVLGRVTVDGVTTLEREDMGGLMADIDSLVEAASLQPEESQGLQRLRAMAEECSARGRLVIVFVGDAREPT
jgi:hypothetical protein